MGQTCWHLALQGGYGAGLAADDAVLAKGE